MSEPESIVVVGGGHAAAQLCIGLAAAGLGSRVHLVCAEPELPYQRPPLSKSYLKSPTETVQAFRTEAWFGEAGITVHRADPAVGIDRTSRSVQLASGLSLGYQSLILATGTRARRLSQIPDGVSNVAVLRTAADARWLRDALAAIQHLTVLGGGFIGLEIAATAAALGKTVTLLESATRLLARSTSPELAEHVLQMHRRHGIDVRLGTAVDGFEVSGARLVSMVVNGHREPVELLLLGIGAEPEDRLARDAGLDCDNGVVVDACMRSSDPAILAIGDCTSFTEHRSGRRVRLESVQNATDQARTALATLTGNQEPYRALPWFWSEQGSLRLQMAGLMPVNGTPHRRPGPTTDSFSVLHYAGDRLACVESVNAPADHLGARKLMDADSHPAPELACEPSTPLKAHL